MICIRKHRMPSTLSRPRPPQCEICSFKQPDPYPLQPVYHQHSSSRQYRILQKVEYKTENLQYLCPTCQTTHLSRLDYGLNICVSDSQLHQFHHPRDQAVVCPPDTSHVDWLTIPGGKIADLDLAWRRDYDFEVRPMRILLVAGVNDLMRGGTRQTVMEAIRHFKKSVDLQNRHHFGADNQFAVAPLLCPPKLVWYADNGEMPEGHMGNRREEIELLNNDILSFNAQSGLLHVPHFYTLGVRRTKYWYEDGSHRNIVQHRFNHWRASEAMADKVHLADSQRVRMGRMVVSYFEGEMQRENGAIAQY